MSTYYRITGRGMRLTSAKLESLAKQCGGHTLAALQPDRIVVDTGRGFVHHYRTTDGDCWNAFERFGGNYAAADLWIECLNAAGYSVLSEHDEGFFRR